MPIKTILDKKRDFGSKVLLSEGHSSRSSFANMTWPIISLEVKFLTSLCVPV